MGWCAFHLDEPVKDWFIRGINKKYEVITTSLVKFNTLYAAIKNVETGQIWCAAYLVNFQPKDYNNFAYKNLDEFDGPVQCNCPERILKLLTPLNDELDPYGYARAWRERCWARINAQKEQAKIMRKAKDKVLVSEKLISFNDGNEYQYFKKTGRNKYYAGKILTDGKFYVMSIVRMTGVNLAILE